MGRVTNGIESSAGEADRAEEFRRQDALERAGMAIDRLRELGVDARLVGSLAKGTFHAHSDIDLIVLECPRHLKYAIEGQIEDCLGPFAFDVIYLEEATAGWRETLLREAVDARDVR